MSERIGYGGAERSTVDRDTASTVSRRAVLAASSAGLASLTGCIFGQSNSTNDVCGDPSNPLPENELNVVSGSGPATIGSNTQWRHPGRNDPQKSRCLEDASAPTKSVRSAWTAEVELEQYPSPTLAGNQVFVKDETNSVVSFDAASGTEQWRSEPLHDPDSNSGSTTIASSEALYARNADRVWSLSTDTGEEQQEYFAIKNESTDGRVGSIYLIGEEQLLVEHKLSAKNILIAYDTETTDRLWEYEYEEGDGSEADLEAATTETAFLRGAKLHAVALGDGSQQWTTDPARIDTISANRTFTRAINEIEAHDITDDGVTQTWKFNGENERISDFAAGNDRVSVTTTPLEPSSDRGFNLYVFDAASGSVKWCEYMGRQATAPAIANDALYVGIGTMIHAFDLFSGDPLWRYQITGDDSVDDIIPVDGALFYSTGSEVGALTTA